MNRTEQDNYKTLYKHIDDEIEKAKVRIVEKKVELQEARKIRKNRQEYDVVARQILDYPDRLEMQTTIRNLEAKVSAHSLARWANRSNKSNWARSGVRKVDNLKKTEAECEKKIELRRKQFSVVLESLSSLKNLLESDSNLDQYLSSQADAPEELMIESEEIQTSKHAANVEEELNDDGEEDNNVEVEKSEKHQTITPTAILHTDSAEVDMQEVIDSTPDAWSIISISTLLSRITFFNIITLIV